MPKIKKRIVTAEEFDDWMATCPVPYDQTDNGLNLTENYEFDLRDVKFKSEKFLKEISRKHQAASSKLQA